MFIMTYSSTQNPVEALGNALNLAQEIKQQAEATEQFTSILGQVSQTPETAELLTLLWNEVLSARRSAAFWQQMSDIEKNMTDKLAANHFQLQQNYLRLMQEQ